MNTVFEILKKYALLNIISLHHEIEENNCVFADGKMLLSILQNIVSNAIKYSRPNGKITIITKRKMIKLLWKFRILELVCTKKNRKTAFRVDKYGDQTK